MKDEKRSAENEMLNQVQHDKERMHHSLLRRHASVQRLFPFHTSSFILLPLNAPTPAPSPDPMSPRPPRSAFSIVI
jgi:hypothetical protein